MKHTSIWVLQAAILLTSLSAAHGTEMTVGVTFRAEDLRFEEVPGFDLVGVEGCGFTDSPGEPMLPIRYVYVALPPGTEVSDADVVSVASEEIAGVYRVYPAQPPLHCGTDRAVAFTPPDPSVYSSASPYPPRAVVYVGTGSMRGHQVASFKVYPLQYSPASGILVLQTQVHITMTLQDSVTPSSVGRRSERAEEAMGSAVRDLVINPEDVVVPFSKGTNDEFLEDGEIQYLIITGSDYVSTFQELADWKIKKGVPTEVVSTDWIYSSYSGDDNQERIRECIKDYEANMGTIWVLLGGDVSVVPYRGCYGRVQSGDGPVEDFDIPCDLYFAELDADWDLDGDGIWGEVDDVVGQLYADVWLGRAPVDNPSEASVFVDKVIAYERAASTSYQTEMLFLAEYLDGETDEAVLKDMIDDESVPGQFNPITKLYESSGNLNRSNTLDELSSGHNCVNHAGHGNTTVMSIGPSSLSNSDMLGLTNAPEYSVLSSSGCYCGAFDANSILEQFVLSPSGGGFSVGNSRYGWYAPGAPGYGAGDRYDREFWSVLFNENDYWIGKTLSQAKAAFVGASSSLGAYRWTQFCLNLLGDPEMPIFTDQPLAMNVQHPDTVPLGSSQFTITVDDGSPLQYAFVCVMKGDEVYEIGMTNPQGEVTIHVSPQTGDTLWITVTARNHVPYEGYAIISGHVPPVAAFTADQTSGLAPFDVQFYSQSTGFIDTWYWQFGDGEESYEDDPLHTYQEHGRYDVMHIACGPAGCDTASEETYVWVWADTLIVEDAYAVPGQPGKNIWVRGIRCDSLSGYGFAMYFDTTYLMVDSVTLTGTSGEGALISVGGVDSTDGYVSWGVVYGFTPPWIPAGDDYLFNVSVTVKPGIAIPSTTWLDLENGIGLANNTFTPWSGGDVFPHLIDGRLIIVDEVSFLRGDGNADSEVSMADAVYLLRYLYVPGTPTPQCMDAVDSDDDGGIAMSDGIYLLRYLYVPGNPSPPAPCCTYPGDCGTDPTADELYCGDHPCNSR